MEPLSLSVRIVCLFSGLRLLKGNGGGNERLLTFNVFSMFFFYLNSNNINIESR